MTLPVPLAHLRSTLFRLEGETVHECVQTRPIAQAMSESLPAGQSKGRRWLVGRGSGRLVSVSEPAQENPQSRSSPEMPTRIVTWLCRIPGLSVGGPDRQCRPPVRNGSEEDHFCGHGTSLAFPRTVLWLFMHACSHDSQGDCVPST